MSAVIAAVAKLVYAIRQNLPLSDQPNSSKPSWPNPIAAGRSTFAKLLRDIPAEESPEQQVQTLPKLKEVMATLREVDRLLNVDDPRTHLVRIFLNQLLETPLYIWFRWRSGKPGKSDRATVLYVPIDPHLLDQLLNAATAIGKGSRLIIDLQTNSLTLDGTTFDNLDPITVRIVEALHQAEGNPVSSTLLCETIPGCKGGEKTVRRHLNTLPGAVRSLIKSKRGSGRYLQLPPKK